MIRATSARKFAPSADCIKNVCDGSAKIATIFHRG